MSDDKKYPDVTIFPDLNITIPTPAGREYRGKVLEHPSRHAEGETWVRGSHKCEPSMGAPLTHDDGSRRALPRK